MKYPDLAKMTDAEYYEWLYPDVVKMTDAEWFWWLRDDLSKEEHAERRKSQAEGRKAEERRKQKWAMVGRLANEAANARGARGRDRRVIVSEVFQRVHSSAEDTCVWCGVDPPRGKTMICQPCNVYRRSNGFPPPTVVIERRVDRRVGYR